MGGDSQGSGQVSGAGEDRGLGLSSGYAPSTCPFWGHQEHRTVPKARPSLQEGPVGV